MCMCIYIYTYDTGRVNPVSRMKLGTAISGCMCIFQPVQGLRVINPLNLRNPNPLRGTATFLGGG